MGDLEWTVGGAFASERKWLQGLGFPLQIKPEDVTGDYMFPNDVTHLTSVQLGSLSLRLSGWHTYLLQELGREDSELVMMQAAYDIKLGLQMVTVRKAWDSKAYGAPLKTQIEALAIDGDEVVKSLWRTIQQRGIRVRGLSTQCDIYDSQLKRLSREQSRRQQDEGFRG